jgi:hypothetical protein|eukprot:SAG25_NODE_205_length_11932_cov_40.485760_9_plen_71_part_00
MRAMLRVLMCVVCLCRRYGALHWTAAAEEPLLEFWRLLEDTMGALGQQYVAVGADEMARLAADAHLHVRP